MKPTKKYVLQRSNDKQISQNLHVCAIVKIDSFDPDKMTVDVQPLSKHLAEGKWQSTPPCLAVPCMSMCGGGFIARPWYKKGDVGIIIYADHDVEKAIGNGQESEPNTERNHSESDGVGFIGIVVENSDIKSLAQGGCPQESFAIGTKDGKQWVSFSKDKIQSQADKWEHKGDIKITGNVELDGDISATGAITATGKIHSDEDVTAAGISLKSHTHSFTYAAGPATGAEGATDAPFS
jgi:hypothetical protein